MKKLILALLVSTSLFGTTQVNAWGHSGGYQRGYTQHGGGYRGGWIAPAVGALIVGGVVGAALAQPYYAPAPVYVQPAPVYVEQQPVIPYGYHYQTMLDPNCNCYKNVLVPN
jgi:hypothetical protein